MNTRRIGITLAVIAIAVAAMAPAAMAKPPYEVFDAKDGWICGSAEGLVDNHCIRLKGNTFNIKVFDETPQGGDARGPQESATTDHRADLRPCPHDNGSSDGTWWVFTTDFNGDGTHDDPLYVCHHSGQQQFLP